MNINFREPSTKRGIVMLITGAAVLIQILSGREVSVEVTATQVEWWIGIGMTVAGLFGLLPDAPSSPPQPPETQEKNDE